MKKKILAIASRGGHWVQLLRLRPAFHGCDVLYVTTGDEELTHKFQAGEVLVVPDGSRTEKVKLFRSLLKLGIIMLRERPDVVVTTGAAVGLVAIRIGKMIGAKTLWLDSIANADELSLSGKLALGKADLVLSQWKHVADKYDGVSYKGEVL